MNTEKPKKTKFDILEEIMIGFQDDYETDNAQTHWVKTYKGRRERLIQLQEEECELQANVIDDAHDLGFVEGVRYALNIMDMTDKTEWMQENSIIGTGVWGELDH